jgi:hypothetical protein
MGANSSPPSPLEIVARIGNPRSNLVRSDRLPAKLRNPPTLRCLPLIAATLFCALAIHAHAESDKTIDVAVRIQGDEAIVDVNFHVGVTPREAWAVMTDYDHATAFISKLEKSVILSRTDEMLMVSQKGTMGFGPFSRTIETVSEMRLTPFERIQSHLISGNMRKSEATTRLIADEGGTRVVFHLESIPDFWMPPLIGRALVELEARARFRQLVDEMLRRKALSETKR